MWMLARGEENIYKKVLQVMEKYEEGQLLGQKAKLSDLKGGLKGMKIYYFRGFSKLTSVAANAVLDLVLQRELSLSMLQKKAKEMEQLQNIQAALMGELDESRWEKVQKRFPHHTKTDQLCNMFGTVSIHFYRIQMHSVRFCYGRG